MLFDVRCLEVMGISRLQAQVKPGKLFSDVVYV